MVDEVTVWGHGVAAMAYGALLVYVVLSGRLRLAAGAARALFPAALALSTAWCITVLLSEYAGSRRLEPMVTLLDLLRYGAWFAFMLSLFAGRKHGPKHGPLGWLPVAATASVGLPLVLLALSLHVGNAYDRGLLTCRMALPVLGLLLVEQLFRNPSEASRWNAKPLCLGLACVFAFDIYLFAEGLLLSHFDADAVAMRGLAHALAVPLLYIASRRGKQWVNRIQVSRTAAFYSATLVLAGSYLIFMAAVGYYVRYFGGSWGRALQLALLAAALASLGVLVLSSTVRSRLRVFVGKHFFSYRFDYREEWLRFTTMLAAKRSPQEMGELIVRGLAKMVECPSGALWMRSGDSGEYVQVANWNLQQTEAHEPADSALCRFLATQGWVIDLDEFRSSPRKYGELALPTWLLGINNGWLVVPLLAGEALQGFVLLSRSLAEQKLNWEVLDLLKTAGRQAAGYLAQQQATEALLEARKFEAFNRMSAFVVHDLKNIVAQLSLMLKNAERLHDNAEFQQDMLLTVESSLEKMRRLMLQLREGATPPGGSRGVELTPIVRRLEALAAAQGRSLDVDIADRLATRGHDERLERVLGHLVQNALDATPISGRVWLRVARYSGQIEVEVGDSGAGMSEEFVRTKLFRPFNTTKNQGMGIGSYESQQYIRELGGSILVDSAPGRGTLIRVRLPLFDCAVVSDLVPLGHR